MASTLQLALPNDRFRLEEINMPEDLASALAGQRVDVEVLPEEPPATRRIDLDDLPAGLPILIDPEGAACNDCWPYGSSTRTLAAVRGGCPGIGSPTASRPWLRPAATRSPMNCAGWKSGVRRRGGTCAT